MSTSQVARVGGCLSWLLMLLLNAPVNAGAAEPSAIKRVLLLHHYSQEVPFRATFDPAIQDALRSRSTGPLDVYVEAIDSYRFPDATRSGLVHD